MHTPWCKTRCPYCAFNVFLSKSEDYERWLSGIARAWEHTSPDFHGRAHSLYFGGGTPSLAPADIIAEIITTLPVDSSTEVTVEVNPGSIDVGGLQALQQAGVNRLSLGVQTFNSDHATRLGRGHSVKQARSLLEAVSTLDFNTWSMDLMFGLPGQTLNQLQRDLDHTLAFNPPHVSLYGLTIEPGTPFMKAESRGALSIPADDTWRKMYDLIVETLSRAGLTRYEVSNFAQEGHRGLHNERIWRGGHYAGLGPGAHGFLPSGARTHSANELAAWYDTPQPTSSTPTQHEAAIDFILSTLRHIDGTSTEQLHRMTGFKCGDDEVAVLLKQRAITKEDGAIRLTHEAFPIADGIVRSLVESLEPHPEP